MNRVKWFENVTFAMFLDILVFFWALGSVSIGCFCVICRKESTLTKVSHTVKKDLNQSIKQEI